MSLWIAPSYAHGLLSDSDLLCSIGKIIVDGKIKKARVFALDASNVYLKGVSDSVKASVDGVSGLFIISASGKSEA